MMVSNRSTLNHINPVCVGLMTAVETTQCFPEEKNCYVTRRNHRHTEGYRTNIEFYNLFFKASIMHVDFNRVSRLFIHRLSELNIHPIVCVTACYHRKTLKAADLTTPFDAVLCSVPEHRARTLLYCVVVGGSGEVLSLIGG